MGVRITGRKGVALRLRRLRAEPLCRDCLSKGVIRAADTPDHIVPLALNGTDTDDNVRCLCVDCHRSRTNEQFGYRTRQELDDDGWPIEPAHEKNLK